MKFYTISPEYRANLYAQAFAFILNISFYAATKNYIFIWVELACASFIGLNTNTGKQFFDRNLINHLITILVYYFLSYIFKTNYYSHLLLIFLFTYCYFILKDNGYSKSFQIWMYIQALLIISSFTSYPFSYKIYATLIAYIESQILLNILFKIFGAAPDYVEENRFYEIFKMPINIWFDPKQMPVRLAIRGSLTVLFLYIICLWFQDERPNWAIVTAIACLQRDDYEASLRCIKGIAIGTLAVWPLALILVMYLTPHTEIAIGVLWICMLLGLGLGFELKMRPSLIFQAINSAAMLIVITCVAISMHISGYMALNMKVINSLVGIGLSLLILTLWTLISSPIKSKI